MQKKIKIFYNNNKLLFTLSCLLLISVSYTSIQPISYAATGFYTENFSSQTYEDQLSNDVSGWGKGELSLRKKLSVIGSISSSFVGNALDIVIDGNYAYVTNEEYGLVVLNITVPSNPSIIGTYETANVASSVFVDGDLLFVTDTVGVAPTHRNILIFDITNPIDPVQLGSCSIFENQNDGANDIVVRGDIAYVANLEKGISAINVTFPSNPIILGEKDTEGTSYDMFVEGDFIYVADGANGLVILNITSPSAITIAANYVTGFSNAVNVEVEGNYAYVLDSSNGLIVVNITDPNSPSLAGTYLESNLNDAVVDGNYLYFLNGEGLLVADITNPATPSLIDSASLSTGIPSSLVVDGCYAYIACYSGGIQIVHITDMIPPTWVGSYVPSDWVFDIDVEGDYAFIADASRGLVICDISNLSLPSVCKVVNAGYAVGVTVEGDYVYVGGGSGLYVFNITNPANPVLAGFCSIPDSAEDIAISGNYAYVASYGGGLQIVNISDPTSPAIVGSLVFPNARGVVVRGNYAFIADLSVGLHVIDISNPSEPILKGTCTTPSLGHEIAISGNYVYIADYGSGLQIIDVSDPTTPSIIGFYNTPMAALDVEISGNYAFIADSSSGLQVLDISNPTDPSLFGSYNTNGIAEAVVLAGDYAFVADGSDGTHVIKIKQTRSLQYDNFGIAQSIKINLEVDYIITKATMNVTDSIPINTSIAYYLSADNGETWENITNGLEYVFNSKGYDLRWKAVLTSSNVLLSPTISSLFIEYIDTSSTHSEVYSAIIFLIIASTIGTIKDRRKTK